MLRRLIGSLRGSPQRPAPAPMPDAGALVEAGAAALQRGDLPAAEAALRSAIRAAPDAANAWGALGMVLWERRQLDEGLACLRKAAALDPAHVGARVNLANAYAVGNRMQEAIAEYREALRLQPGHARASANLAKPLLDTCDWEAAERFASDLIERWRADAPAAAGAITPFASLLYDLPAELRLDVARRYADAVAARVAAMRAPERRGPLPGRRIRLGYASADFHNHATMHLAAGVFEHHDRSRFEVHAYSFGPDDGSACRQRVVAAFEHFHELSGASPDAIAQRIAADAIDVLVDLKGYTTGSRPEILALRPAPVQINWLGYPGTMAAPFMDYIFADRHVIPPGDEIHFGECTLRLDGSYQANDDMQAIAAPPSREACGLPQGAFVFACFNAHYKIERRAFESWMAILAAVPGSVLWLLGGHGIEALRGAARERGVDPSRLVFAGKLPKAEHLARHAVADLFLDTFTCNAHTTASDALWAGLPLLTCAGSAFAGRVASSLLHAVGLPELVARDAAEYERIAVSLARDRGALNGLRGRLQANRRTMPLFDTARFTRGLEAAFAAVHEGHREGRPPQLLTPRQ
jgi:predicted O-linked N-acetylglucosamine transferase (SPINDLY family)